MTNFEYLKNMPIDLLASFLRGIVKTSEIKDLKKLDVYFTNWLKSDVDSDLQKDKYLEYCKNTNEYNQLITENQKLRKDNDYLAKEISKLSRESIKREIALAKLEADVITCINKSGFQCSDIDDVTYDDSPILSDEKYEFINQKYKKEELKQLFLATRKCDFCGSQKCDGSDEWLDGCSKWKNFCKSNCK